MLARAATLGAFAAAAAAAAAPQLVVLAVGSGSSALTTAAAPLSVVTLNATSGAVLSTTSVPCTQYGLPTGSPTSNQEGLMSLSLAGACGGGAAGLFGLGFCARAGTRAAFG